MPYQLSIVTPQGIAYEGEVDSIVLPGSEGDFGVLADHERFLTPLRVGEVEIQTGAELLFAATASGFAEVTGNAVAVLVEACELADEIDHARAEAAHAQAEQSLGQLAADDDDERYAEYEAALERAKNRLSVSGRRS
ncbi:ATP synthase F1 subunit epsilon [Myxococcota bacterium]|nr:ATP synthase F1 subunit epsilon [Myxococcota bacterium]